MKQHIKKVVLLSFIVFLAFVLIYTLGLEKALMYSIIAVSSFAVVGGAIVGLILLFERDDS